jgi:ammonia channel protein AmtB
MKNEELEKKYKELRIQAKNQVIILISSLILVFLWFSFFSWITNRRTFSGEAFYHAARALGMEISYVVPLIFLFASVFTIFYIILLKKFSLKIKKKSIEKSENNNHLI